MVTDDPFVQSRETVNPYLSSGIVIFQRFLWDMKYQSWLSRARLKKIKNSQLNEKAVILCNGPSLLNVDFDLLIASGVFTFGLNKIDLLFKKTEFRPSCIVAVNPHVIEQNKEFYNKTEIPLYLDSIGVKKQINFRNNVSYLHSTSIPKFAKDCSFSVNQGHTVTAVALQLAFHMGFKQVALVGADHNFDTKGPANKLVVAGEKDENHFDPNYFSKGVKWELPDLFESEVWYGRANQMYNAHERKIYNATTGGLLEVFNRITLSSFLNDKQG